MRDVSDLTDTLDEGRASSVSAGHWSSAIPRPRAEASESRHPWRHRSARGAPASSARDPTSGRRVRRPQRAITPGWLWTKTARSACHERADPRIRPTSSQAAPNDDRAVGERPSRAEPGQAITAIGSVGTSIEEQGGYVHHKAGRGTPRTCSARARLFEPPGFDILDSGCQIVVPLQVSAHETEVRDGAGHRSPARR